MRSEDPAAPSSTSSSSSSFTDAERLCTYAREGRPRNTPPASDKAKRIEAGPFTTAHVTRAPFACGGTVCDGPVCVMVTLPVVPPFASVAVIVHEPGVVDAVYVLVT